MRVAALYDIHGNAPALHAVLAAAEQETVDLLVFGGDLAWGPLPRQTMDVISSLDPEVRFVRGNADREVAERAGAEQGLDQWTAEVNLWCVDQLDEEQLRFLGTQPPTQELEIPDLGSILFCHGSPRSDEETITERTPVDRLERMLEGTDAEIVVCGHTHAQFDRSLPDGRRVVNPGSVGLPFGAPGAYWALLEDGGIRLQRTTYDFEAAARAFLEGGAPAAEGFAAHVSAPPPHGYAAEKWG